MPNPPLSVKAFIDDSFGENAYVLSTPDDAGGRVGWIIDPSFPPQVSELLDYVAAERIRIDAIVLTHGHADHIAGLDEAKAAHPDAQVLIAREDEPMLTDGRLNLSAPFGFPITCRTPATGHLDPGAELTLGGLTWKILDTSGHSPGGRSLYCPQADVVISGDALFAGSIGRTDFPGSNHHQLIRNIRRHLLTLPETCLVYSGHGPVTTIGNERKSNPFLTDAIE